MDERKAREAAAIFSKILKEIKPTPDEILKTTADVDAIMERLREVVPKSVEVRVTGSIAKGTDLRDSHDIDIFLLFGKGSKRSEIAKKGLAYAKKIVRGKKNERYEIKYAEHPYLRLYLMDLGLKVDVVPALRIDNIDEMVTSVDRSPLHADYINSALRDRQKDDVRLLKYLLKAHGIHGAEVKVRGFSSYLCELLIDQYGSLFKLLESAQHFRLPMHIDPKHKKVSYDKNLVKRFHSEFVVIDPVDKDRNVAASVSKESLARLVVIARQFIEKPSVGMFYGKGFDAVKARGLFHDLLDKSGMESFLIVTKVPDKSVDVTWPQLRKVTEIIVDNMRTNGFETYLALPWIENGKGFILVIAPRLLLKTRLYRGPDVFLGKATNNFIKRHSKAMGFVFRESTINALEKSRYESLEDFAAAVAKGGVLKTHKDISIKGATLYVNKIPKEYAETAYFELSRKLSV